MHAPGPPPPRLLNQRLRGEPGHLCQAHSEARSCDNPGLLQPFCKCGEHTHSGAGRHEDREEGVATVRPQGRGARSQGCCRERWPLVDVTPGQARPTSWKAASSTGWKSGSFCDNRTTRQPRGLHRNGERRWSDPSGEITTMQVPRPLPCFSQEAPATPLHIGLGHSGREGFGPARPPCDREAPPHWVCGLMQILSPV